MRLIRRCGHRTKNLVAIDDIDGHIQDLMQQLFADDLEKRGKPDVDGAVGWRMPSELQIADNSAQPALIEPKSGIAPVETPPHTPWADRGGSGVGAFGAGVPGGALSGGFHGEKKIPPNTLVDSGEISAHMNFREINFDAPGEPLRKLSEFPGRWAEDQLGGPPTHFADVPLNTMQKSVEDRRAEQRVESHFAHQEAGLGRHLYRACLVGGLGNLISSGANADSQLALAGGGTMEIARL